MDPMFGSDNGVGVSPEILAAIADANGGYASAWRKAWRQRSRYRLFAMGR